MDCSASTCPSSGYSLTRVTKRCLHNVLRLMGFFSGSTLRCDLILFFVIFFFVFSCPIIPQSKHPAFLICMGLNPVDVCLCTYSFFLEY